jgi:hypothetical protein
MTVIVPGKQGKDIDQVLRELEVTEADKLTY